MIFKRLSRALVFAAMVSAGCMIPTAAQAVRPTDDANPTPCTANELTLAFDTEQGNFNGMSHSGARLILRNIGIRVCTVPQRPQLIFQDAAGKPVGLRMAVPPGMHPGPVALLVAVPPEAEATGTMRWVSNDAYGVRNCAHPSKAILTLGSQAVHAAFPFNVCGPAGALPQYEQQSLHRDAVYTPHGAIR